MQPVRDAADIWPIVGCISLEKKHMCWLFTQSMYIGFRYVLYMFVCFIFWVDTETVYICSSHLCTWHILSLHSLILGIIRNKAWFSCHVKIVQRFFAYPAHTHLLSVYIIHHGCLKISTTVCVARLSWANIKPTQIPIRNTYIYRMGVI